jgi:transposase
MDFHLDTLLNLPNVTVFTCYQELGFNFLQLQFINEGINCPNCQKYTDTLDQTRQMLVRDLSIFGTGVYLKVPRRKFYCDNCKKYPTEQLSWLEKRQLFTCRYQEYIYTRVKELTTEQVSRSEQLSAEQVQQMFHKIAQRGLKNRCLLLKNNQVLEPNEKTELEIMLNHSPCLRIAYCLKEELRDISESKLTVKGGLRLMKKWLVWGKLFIGDAANAISNHLPEIANYFIDRTTSGVTEGINTRIKLIVRQSYGFKSFELMRKKLLVCLLK